MTQTQIDINEINENLPFSKLCQIQYSFNSKTKKLTYPNQSYFVGLQEHYNIRELTSEYIIKEHEINPSKDSMNENGLFDVISWNDKNMKHEKNQPKQSVHILCHETKTVIIQFEGLYTNILYNKNTKVSDLVQFYFQLCVHLGLIKDDLYSANWMQYGLQWIDPKGMMKLLRGSSLVWGMLSEKIVLKFVKMISKIDYNEIVQKSSVITPTIVNNKSIVKPSNKINDKSDTTNKSNNNKSNAVNSKVIMRTNSSFSSDSSKSSKSDKSDNSYKSDKSNISSRSEKSTNSNNLINSNDPQISPIPSPDVSETNEIPEKKKKLSFFHRSGKKERKESRSSRDSRRKHDERESKDLKETNEIFEIDEDQIQQLIYSEELSSDISSILSDTKKSDKDNKDNTSDIILNEDEIENEIDEDDDYEEFFEQKTSHKEETILCCVMIQNEQTFDVSIRKSMKCKELKEKLYQYAEIEEKDLLMYKRIGMYSMEEIDEDLPVSHYAGNDSVLLIDLVKPSKEVFLIAGRISSKDIPLKSTIKIDLYLLSETPKLASCGVINSFTICLTQQLSIRDILFALYSTQDFYVFTHTPKSINLSSSYDLFLCDTNIIKIGIVKSTKFPFSTSLLQQPKTYRIISNLLPKEALLYIDNSIYITTYQTIVWDNNKMISIPHHSVANFTIVPISESFNVIGILTKSIMFISFEVPSPVTQKIISIYNEFKLLFPREKKDIFCFRPQDTIESRKKTAVEDILVDYQRMGAFDNDHFVIAFNISTSAEFCETMSDLLTFNCPTYPSKIIIPRGDYDLSSMLTYRAKGRFPFISWVGPQHQCLARSSQPLQGTFGQKQCESDVAMLLRLMAFPNKKIFYIYDVRSKLNTTATRIQGGGIESQSSYPFCNIENLNMDTIKDIKQAFYKLIKTMLFEKREMYDFRVSFENSKWLQMIDQLISYASSIAKKLSSGYSLLIHCRNGWDITCQLTSLVLLMVDKYYRTIEGFMTLIHREWVDTGHRFLLRTGSGVKWDIDIQSALLNTYQQFKKSNVPQINYDSSMNDKATSPIFFMFIEAVHHILINYPNYFEFNDKMLVFIADSLYDGRFTTFYDPNADLSNPFNVHLLDYLLENKNEFVNNNYDSENGTCFPTFTTSNLTIWNEYFFRYPSNSIHINYTMK